MIKEGEVITLKQKIPNRWNKAIEQFAKNKILPKYLGTEFCKTFVANSSYEEMEFNNKINSLDFDWYLRSV